jgi:AcrR family transcriptional regulator
VEAMSLKEKKILEATIFLFANLGEKKLSMALVAEKAKVSKPLIYHYFSTKKQLILAAKNYASSYASRVLDDLNPSLPFFEKMFLVQSKKLQLEEKIPNIYKFILSYTPLPKTVPNYPFSEQDLATLIPEADPQLLYQLLHYVSLGFSQQLEQNVSAKELFDRYLKIFLFIKKLTLKEGSQ